jgi:predicted dinucleotide-binding enzyme
VKLRFHLFSVKQHASLTSSLQLAATLCRGHSVAHDPLAVRRIRDRGEERDAIAPADAVVLAVPHNAYVAEGWCGVVPLLKNGGGVVIDIKGRFDRATTPEGIGLWRL